MTSSVLLLDTPRPTPTPSVGETASSVVSDTPSSTPSFGQTASGVPIPGLTIEPKDVMEGRRPDVDVDVYKAELKEYAKDLRAEADGFKAIGGGGIDSKALEDEAKIAEAKLREFRYLERNARKVG